MKLSRNVPFTVGIYGLVFIDFDIYVMEKELSGPSFGRLCFISVKSDAYMTYRSVCKLDSNIEGNNLTSWV